MCLLFCSLFFSFSSAPRPSRFLPVHSSGYYLSLDTHFNLNGDPHDIVQQAQSKIISDCLIRGIISNILTYPSHSTSSRHRAFPAPADISPSLLPFIFSVNCQSIKTYLSPTWGTPSLILQPTTHHLVSRSR
jgi:hypothetical protein